MSEREQFEAWAKEFSPETPLWQDNCGQYVYWSSEWTAWQAARAQPAQAEAVPPGYVLAPIDLLEAASESLGSFVSDQGWTALDMQAMDNLDAILAQQKGQP